MPLIRIPWSLRGDNSVKNNSALCGSSKAADGPTVCSVHRPIPLLCAEYVTEGLTTQVKKYHLASHPPSIEVAIKNCKPITQREGQ